MELELGQKLKALRQASDLTQEELANRAELTKGFISQLENNLSSVQVDSLADILEALGVTMAEFFTDAKEPQVVFGPSDRVAVDGTGANSFELLVPGSTNNDLDPVLIELAPGEELEKKAPHPGELFGFILKGTLTVKLNKTTYKVPSKHCLYFTADKPHQLMNKGGVTCSLLWVTTPPQM